MIQTRSRLISFRLSEEEFESIRAVCESQGVRSVSAFVRWCIVWVLSNWDRRLKDIMFVPGGLSERQPVHTSGIPGVVPHVDGGPESAVLGEPAPDMKVAIDDLKAQVELLSKVIRDLTSGRQ